MQATFETRVKDASVWPLLDAVADLFCRAERELFVDCHVRGQPLSDLKREYLVRFGFTARQFNAHARQLEGKVSAAKVSLENRQRALAAKIAALEERIAKTQDSLSSAKAESRRKIRFALHQRKRRLGRLRTEAEACARALSRPVSPLCFGGCRLFRAQFHFRENGYSSHGEWLADWRAARSSGFLCLGSKDGAAEQPG